jgi:hypothetical protein
MRTEVISLITIFLLPGLSLHFFAFLYMPFLWHQHRFRFTHSWRALLLFLILILIPIALGFLGPVQAQ